jgi:peptidylprolyl isomerase
MPGKKRQVKQSSGKTKFVVLGMLITFVLSGVVVFMNPFGSSGNQQSSSTASAPSEVVVIETNMGTIVFKFYSEVAPKTVENFKKLADEKFYDGTKFHRIIPGFMIQGGDPNSRDADRSKHGLGGPGYNVPAEFSSVKHKRGIVSMARAQDINSAGSQFFIVVKDSFSLDGQYTVFGEVIQGMDVADKIVNVQRDGNDNPIEPVVMQRVYIKKG